MWLPDFSITGISGNLLSMASQLKNIYSLGPSSRGAPNNNNTNNRNIYPDAVTRDRMRLIDPKRGQLEPIHHCCLVVGE